MVRLKVPCVDEHLAFLRFQFLMVRLKAPAVGDYAYIKEFQFLMVRLKVVKFALVFVVELGFNSLWFD